MAKGSLSFAGHRPSKIVCYSFIRTCFIRNLFFIVIHSHSIRYNNSESTIVHKLYPLTFGIETV